MTKEKLNDLLELIEAQTTNNKQHADCADAVRFAELKDEFIAKWCDK